MCLDKSFILKDLVVKKFLMTKSFNINDLSRQISVYKNEGDFYDF